MNGSTTVPSPEYKAMMRRLARQIDAGVTGKALDALIHHELQKLAAQAESDVGYLLPRAKDTRSRRPSDN
jgi:hypothetical protein